MGSRMKPDSCEAVEDAEAGDEVAEPELSRMPVLLSLPSSCSSSRETSFHPACILILPARWSTAVSSEIKIAADMAISQLSGFCAVQE